MGKGGGKSQWGQGAWGKGKGKVSAFDDQWSQPPGSGGAWDPWGTGQPEQAWPGALAPPVEPWMQAAAAPPWPGAAASAAAGPQWPVRPHKSSRLREDSPQWAPRGRDSLQNHCAPVHAPVPTANSFEPLSEVVVLNKVNFEDSPYLKTENMFN